MQKVIILCYCSDSAGNQYGPKPLAQDITDAAATELIAVGFARSLDNPEIDSEEGADVGIS